MRSTVGEIAQAMEGRLLQGDTAAAVSGVATDSRAVTGGEVFFALRGQSADGHRYVVDALRRSAAAAVVSRAVEVPPELAGRGLVMVPDVLHALQALSAWHRRRFHPLVVAVTGSVGKTTTKEMVAHCLQARFRTLRTAGNYNNEIGVPLTLLALNPSHQACVVEMAMRAKGEIAALAALAAPHCAVLTNVAPVHLETLGSLEAIAAAKCEVLAALPEEGFAVVNGDCPHLEQAVATARVRLLRFGYASHCDYRLLSTACSRHGLEVQALAAGRRMSFRLSLPVPELAYNAMAAIAVAVEAGVPLDELPERLASFVPAQRRLSLVSAPGGLTIIDDCYNANPLSMRAGLHALVNLAPPGRSIAVLGDMYELGAYAAEGHRQVGRTAAEMEVDLLVAVGELSVHLAAAAREAGMAEAQVAHFTDKEEALAWLRDHLRPGDTVLVKASRGMGLETIVGGLLAGLPTAAGAARQEEG